MSSIKKEQERSDEERIMEMSVYIPFLHDLIQKIESSKEEYASRQPQLRKMKSLHTILSCKDTT